MFTVCRRTVKANNYLSFQPRGKCETWRSGKFAVKSLPKSAENASSTFGASVGVTFKLNLPPKGQGVREICIPLHGVRQWEIPSPLVQPRGWPKVLRSIELTAVPFYHLLFFLRRCFTVRKYFTRWIYACREEREAMRLDGATWRMRNLWGFQNKALCKWTLELEWSNRWCIECPEKETNVNLVVLFNAPLTSAKFIAIFALAESKKWQTF